MDASTERRRIVLVGGANTDISGMSVSPLVVHDSNPGHVRISAGGVARNVAENLTLLGVQTHLITVFGGDLLGRDLAEECRAAGIDTAGSLGVSDMPGSVYLAIMDDRGEMSLGLSDMRALDALTPEMLEARTHLFDEAELVFVDTNLSVESLEWVVGRAQVPVVLDAVSVAKAPRTKRLLPKVYTLKASGLEAGVLLDREVRNRDQAEDAARELVSLGVAHAFVTTGVFGSAWADSGTSGHLAAPAVAEVRNVTGAGDAFAAGVAYGTLEGWRALETVAFGSACASIALESELTVNERMSLELAAERMHALLA